MAQLEDQSPRTVAAAYAQPRAVAAWWQIANSFIPFVALCAAMYLCFDRAPWLVPPLSVMAAGFVIRIFIIQHDCGHGSFFASRRANDWVGVACSLVTVTPYLNWRRQHSGHHGDWNNLDRRANADLYSNCMTVDEYAGLSRVRRGLYRVTRNPLLTLGLLPTLVFLLVYRTPFDAPRSWRKERWGVHLTNLALILIFGLLMAFVGVWRVCIVQLPVLALAATGGVWLFSVQHRFEGTLWARKQDWDFAAAALDGSSYLKLPRLLQWFTGNIGFHHIHHLNPRVPNYRLEDCHGAVTKVHQSPPMGLRRALKAWRFALWDEQAGRMVSFRSARRPRYAPE